jgi:hypothetical protein
MKLKALLVSALAFFGFGCSEERPAPTPAPIQTEGIQIIDGPNDKPKFARTYIAAVGNGFTIKIKRYDSTYRRFDMSELDQVGGKWILFDADRVADKIIDRDLYPLVQAKVDAILALDKAYIDSKPDEFTDESGVTWRKVQK